MTKEKEEKKRMHPSEDCLFCKIVNKQIPSKIVYEDDQLLAFADIAPKAPVHLLIIPKRHIASLAETQEEDQGLLGRMLWVANHLAEKSDLNGTFRTVINSGTEAGQTVFHLHLHLLGGRPFHWPPG